MDKVMGRDDVQRTLASAGLSETAVQVWIDAEPKPAPPGAAGSARERWAAIRPFVTQGDSLLDRIPARSTRSHSEQIAADVISEQLRDQRVDFMRSFTADVFNLLAPQISPNVRAEELVALAAIELPGLTPGADSMQKEASLPLKDKAGIEIDQGFFLWQILSHPDVGARLIHSMLRPTAAAIELVNEFTRVGHADLGLATATRDGNVGVVELRNTDYLNAEDNDTNRALEQAIDLVLLDQACAVGVLRGAPVRHPRYAGRRVFNAGLNLTQLYQGRLPFLFYITRDLGLVNKIYRGHSPEEFRPTEGETGVEKPWIAAVEAFAIGGGCQLLLVMDHVLAEQGAYFNLPARKEGIIPGAANLRLPRFVGDRIARRGILFDQRFEAESPEGQLLCDEIVPRDEMDAAIRRIAQSLSSSGVVSAAGNRKAIRVAQEPLSVFQAYMATYAREQALCHLSPALVRNLEQYWLSHRAANRS